MTLISPKQPLMGGTLVVVSVVLISCGPSKTTQCQDILQTIQQAESGQVLGNQNRAAYQANAQLYQGLADALAAMTMRDEALQEHQHQLVEAYQALAVSRNNFAEASDENGRLSYIVGDRDAKAAVDAIQAEQMQANNKVNMAMALFYNTCAN